MRHTAIVTGGSRGIGAEIARELGAMGFAVAVNYARSRAAAEAVAEEIAAAGGCAAALGGDVSDPEQAERLARAAAEQLGPVELLVNNAGISHFSLAQDTLDADWRRVFAVNMDGVFHMCRAVLPGMIARKAGRIVNIGSMWGQVGVACESAYAASKAAVIGYTKSLAKELGPSGILVNCVCPGLIDTEMNAHLAPEEFAAVVEETPIGRAGRPEDVARVVAFLAQDGFLTGQVLGVNGGLVIG